MCQHNFISLLRGTARLPLIAIALLLGFTATAQAANKVEGVKAAEASIRASAAAFTKAFNQGDAKSVAELWTPNGTLADERGVILKGRKAIQDEYAAQFKAQPGARVQIGIQSIEFPAAGLAVEDGIATVVAKNSPPTASRYTALHVLSDGNWQMASVRESSVNVSSNYGRLQDLEWLVGSWETKGHGIVVHTTIRWVANKSFLLREYTVLQDGATVSSGMQIIGFDPQAGQIRSWSFDGSGGHGTGYWTATSDGWRLRSAGVMVDGTPTSSVDFVIRVPNENNVLGWRSVNRRAGGNDLPNTPEIVLERVTGKR